MFATKSINFHYKREKDSLLYKVFRMKKKLSQQAEQYKSDDFKNFYRYVKTLNLLNQLYLSEAIGQQEFEEQEKDILARFDKVKAVLKKADLERFAELYGIENEYKRVQSESKSDGNKKIIQVAMLLTGKISELFDTLHQSSLVKDIVNIVAEVDMLLKNLQKHSDKISPEFAFCIKKMNDLYQSIRSKSIHEELTSMESYELEDAITKIKIHFEQFANV